MKSRLNKDICIIYNSLIEEDYKLDRLISSIEEMIHLRPSEIRIRVRGKCSKKAILKLNNQKENFSNYTQLYLYEGENYYEWKLNTLEMYLGSTSSYVMLMQEDYKISCTSEEFIDYLNYCFHNSIDYVRISNPSTSRNSHFFTMNLEEMIDTFTLNTGNWEDYRTDQRYLLSFPGCYKSEIFLKNLLSNRPFIRKYHPFSPFDFEKGPNQTWLLPMKCAVANFEILTCIDDDLGFPGSSLQSRGLVKIDKVRNHNHVSQWSARKIFFRMSILSRKIFKNNSLTSYESWPKFVSDFISNFLNLFYKVLFFFDILKYSAHAQIYYIFNFKGHLLRRSAKSKLSKIINGTTN